MSPKQTNDDDIKDKEEAREEADSILTGKSMTDGKIPVRLGEDSTLNLS